jgi:exopolysaccharide biosynthesis polyprenyl glycosylphosphotransferase
MEGASRPRLAIISDEFTAPSDGWFMVRRYVTALRLALMAADGISAIALFVFVSIVRFGGDSWQDYWSGVGIDGRVIALLYAVGWVVVLWLFGLYRLRVRWSARTEVIDVARSVLLIAIATFVVLFWLKLPNVSRQFLLLLFPAQLVLTVASRFALRSAFARARSRGFNSRFVLVVGTGPAAQAFADRIEAHREMGLHVIGHLAGPDPGQRDPGLVFGVGTATLASTAADFESGTTTLTRPILGTIEDIEHILHTRIVDEVVVCLSPTQLAFVEPVTRLCEDEGRIVRIPTDETGLTLPGARIEEFDGIRVLSLVYGPDRVLAMFGKRIVDIVFALAGLILLSPLFLGVTLAMLALDGRPVIFRQVRVGLHGRPFSIVKFRTMTRDAEERYAEVAALSNTRGAAFKMTNDPRITSVGRLLRKSSIDELPQLWNVLIGDMSIVGPRPAPPREVEAYDVWHRRRLSMKPGITGLWQVEARFDEEFDHRARLDLTYIDRWSIWLDLKIIARTIPAVVANPGR